MIRAYYVLFLLVLGLYILASIRYWLLFYNGESRRIASARIFLYLALAAHTLLLILISSINRNCPVTTASQGILFCAWMIGLGHLTSEFFAKSKPMGVFTLLPITLAVLVSLVLGEPVSAPPENYRGAYFSFHLVSSLAAFSSFTIAAILSSMYVLLFKKLKSKQFDIFFRNLPPLDNMELLMTIWAVFGCLFMSAASFIGRLWVRQSGITGMDPRELGIFSVLLVYVGVLAAKKFLPFRGIRFAAALIFGFVFLLATQVLGVHGF